MNRTENILLQLTGRALFGAPVDFDPAAVDWPALYREASAQTISLLIWDVLSDEERAAIPEACMLRWEQDSFRHIMNNERFFTSRTG